MMKTGVLSHTREKRQLHTKIGKLRHPPKCGSCQYGKQTTRPAKTKRNQSNIVRDEPPPVVKDGKTFPGQTSYLDHYVCSTKGVTLSSRGGANSKGYTGGCIIVDAASAHVFTGMQQHLNTHETRDVLDRYESGQLELLETDT